MMNEIAVARAVGSVYYYAVDDLIINLTRLMILYYYYLDLLMVCYLGVI